MNSNKVIFIVLFLVLVTSWWLVIPLTYAQTSDKTRFIEGQLLNGSFGGSIPSGVIVKLHEESPTKHDHRETLTDSDGRFKFDEIDFSSDVLYGVSVGYRGGLYGTDVDISKSSVSSVLITVYESTEDDSLLTVSNSSLLISQVNEMAQTIRAFEIVRIVNDTDRTYVPGPNPMDLLRFGLPSEANGLLVESSFLEADVLQVDRGFALITSVPPGDHDLMYVYDFPYAGDHANFVKTFPYGTGELRVLVSQEVGSIVSMDLRDFEVVTIDGRSYKLLRWSQLERGSKISFDLLELPNMTIAARLLHSFYDMPVQYIVPLGLALLMSVLIGVILLRRYAVTPAHLLNTQIEEGETGRSQIIWHIAELESKLSDGSISEEQYRKKRKSLIAQLTNRSTRGSANLG